MRTNTQMSRRTFLRAAALALAAPALAACGAGNAPQNQASTTTAATTSSYEPASLKVAFMPNLGSASTLLTAIDKGYFEEVGITVETQQFQAGPAEIAAMASGDIDISQIGHGAHALAIQGQAKVFAFDQLSKADEVVANKAKGISSAADLKGKTVGVASGTSSEAILTLVLAKAGLAANDINRVEMDVAGMTTALISGQIDAAATWSPNTVTLKAQLGDNYLSLGTDTDFTDTVAFPSSFVVTPDFAGKNEDVLVRFGAALDKAKAYRAEHIDEVVKIVAAKIDVPEETLQKSSGEGDWQSSVDAIGNVDKLEGYYKAQQKIFLDAKKIEKEVPVTDYVLTDVITKADELYDSKLK